MEFARALEQSGVEVIVADSNYRRLKSSRDAGLDIFMGEVLSEDAEIKLDHARFSTVIALSTNDSYNALVCSHFAPEVGRHMVYQLSISDDDENDERGVSSNARGRTLIRRGRTYDSLIRDQYRGWEFARTRLTDKYSLENFRQDRPNADIVAELRADGTLVLLGPNREARGGEGAILISFSPELDDSPKEAPTLAPA